GSIHPCASAWYSAGLLEWNLPSEQSEREGEAPPALPVEGATQAPTNRNAYAFESRSVIPAKAGIQKL
ncbi:MAG: hypothetical protein HY877_02205, partial [Deltaproteobacteria bacterium]|nr:hypothetical protein [Deltaproteobacteria bacterium]